MSFRFLLHSLLMTLPLGALAQERVQTYEVRGLGVKLGTFQLTSTTGDTSYSVASRFETSGMMQVFARIRMDMRASGTLDGLSPQPAQYVENIDTGRRQSDVTLTWSAGLPQVTGGHLNPEGTPADPAAQGDALDPASMLFRAATPRPQDSLCGLDQPVFDGARRTRVTLAAAQASGDVVTCTGQFIREAGYSDEQLARAKSFDLDLSYAPGPEGLYVLTEAKIETILGPLRLTLSE